MAKNKEKEKMGLFSDEELCDEEPSRMEAHGKALKMLKAEKAAAYKKNKRKEKKERKAKHDAKILVQDNAKREAGKIALKMIKVTRQAVKDFKKLPSSEKKGFIDFSDQGLAIKKEFLKLKKEMVGFWAKN